MSVPAILVIDAEGQRRQEVKAILEFLDQDEVRVADPAGWRNAVADAELDAVLLGDCGTPEEQLDVYRDLRRDGPHIPLLLMRGKDSPPAADEVVNGVLGVLDLPLRYRPLTGALQQAQVFREGQTKQATRRSPELFRSLVGNSRSVRHVRKLIEQVATTDATVLILGESGTGKEVVARNIHYHSTRRNKPFVPINCGAIPGDLLESELFGHEKGAFTGAITARQGRFEIADGGTLFLDEIGDMSLHMQVKLLRVLQEKTFERVGSNKSISADVRIIAATHRNLEEAIINGKFREDLFYRLNVFPIEMPPLRERREDIPLLIAELVTRMEHEKRGSVRLTQQAIMSLCQHHWPGNVRELANLVERLVIMHPYGLVDVGDMPEKFRRGFDQAATIAVELPEPMAAQFAPLGAFDPLAVSRLPREGLDLRDYLNQLEYDLIKQALEDAGGVVAHAAQRLQLRRTTLVEKMRKYGLHRGEDVT